MKRADPEGGGAEPAAGTDQSHFLYNVLSSISSMAMRSGNVEIMDMVEHLALFYRIS